MARRIAAYCLYILGFLTVTFFRHYSGEIIPYPFIFWVIGMAMFWAGYLLQRHLPSSGNAALIKENQKEIDDLKINGEKIMVDFRICEIRENNYTEQQDPYYEQVFSLGRPDLFQALNEMGDNTGSTKIPTINQTVIVFPYENRRTGKTERFISRVIPKDQVTLSFYLDKQQQTNLYVDKTERNKYYFDLDFLSPA